MEKLRGSSDNNNADKILLIGVGGPSSSGKTIASKSLQKLFPNSILLHQDDFYVHDDDIPLDPIRQEKNWDSPEAINFDKFIEYLKTVKSGKDIPQKIDSLEPEPDLKLTNVQLNQLKIKINDTFRNYLIIIVDGFMLFHDPYVSDLFDIKLFYHASYNTLKTRRSNRQGYSTVAGFWVDPPNYFDDFVWPAYENSHKYLFKNGDINSDLDPKLKSDLQLADFKNENSTLFDLVDWALDEILKFVKK